MRNSIYIFLCGILLLTSCASSKQSREIMRDKSISTSIQLDSTLIGANSLYVGSVMRIDTSRIDYTREVSVIVYDTAGRKVSEITEKENITRRNNIHEEGKNAQQNEVIARQGSKENIVSKIDIEERKVENVNASSPIQDIAYLLRIIMWLFVVGLGVWLVVKLYR